MCKGNLSRVSLARSVTRPQATGFALQNRTNTKKDTLLRVFFRVGTPDWIRTSGLQSRSLSLYPTELRAHIWLSLYFQPWYYSSSSYGCKAVLEKLFCRKIVKKVDNYRIVR